MDSVSRNRVAGLLVCLAAMLITAWVTIASAIDIYTAERGTRPRGMPGGPTQSKGTHAPDFELRHLEGGRVRLSDHRGQVVLLNFWATWCGPCREELPHVQKLHETYGDQGLVVITVSTDPTRRPVSRYVSRHAFTFTVLMADGSIQSDYGVSGIPVTFLIDRSGMIRYVKQGFGPGAASELEDRVAALLEEETFADGS